MKSLISIGLHDLDFSGVIDAAIKQQVKDKKNAEPEKPCSEKEEKCCDGKCCH